MLGVDSENFTGVLTSFIDPQTGCSTSLTMPRARTSVARSVILAKVYGYVIIPYRVRDSTFPGYHSPPHTAYHFRAGSLATLSLSLTSFRPQSKLQARCGS